MQSGIRSRALLAGLVLAASLHGAVVQAQSDQRPVTAVGRAAGEDLKAKDEAKADAKRNAVEQACGALINAQSDVEDFQLKKDRILSTAAGYITSYEVSREWVESGISHCEIRATVSVGKFEADWAAMFKHLKEDVENPRCIVVIIEDNDVDDHHPPKVNGICQSRMEHYFLKHDVQLMDKGVTEDVQARDVELAALNENINTLAARAAGFHADLLVYGKAEAKRGSPVEIGGRTVNRWDITLNVRAVQADSAQILMSNSYRPKSPYKSTSAACGDDAFTQLIDDVADQVLRDIADAWKKGLTSHQIFRVQFEGVSRKDFRDGIMPALTAVRGVAQGDEGVKLREAVNDVVTAEVYWQFDLNALADTIEDLEVEGMEFEVVEQSANRIRCKVINKQ